MTTAEPIIIPIEANPADFIADAKKVQEQMDILKYRLEKAGVSQAAFNQAVANNTKAFNAQVAATKQASISMTDFRSAYMIAMDAVRIGGQIWQETGQKLVDYAAQVRDVSRSLGTSTEEASRLIQVADDVGISYQSLTTSLRLAQKDGIDPSISGLAALSDEYLALAPGVERTQFLLDNFGRSGAEMGKLLEKGSAAIREMNEGIDESMILTQKAVDDARRYEIAVDNLGDAWDAFTYKVAPPLIKALTDVLQHTTLHTRALEIMEEQGLSTYHAMGTVGYAAAYKMAEAEREAAEANLLASDATDTLTDSMESQEDTAELLAEKLKQLSAENMNYLSTLGSLTNEIKGFEDKQQSLIEQNQQLIDERTELAHTYGWESEQVAELNEKLAENEEAQAANAEAFELASKTRLLAMLEERLAFDGLDDAETEFLLSKGLEWGVYSQQAVDAMRAAQFELGLLMGQYSQFSSMTMTPITISTMSSYAPQINARRASGTNGWETVPPGYNSDNYTVGMTSGEKYQVIPAGGTGSPTGGGSSIVVNNYFQQGCPDCKI